MSLQKQHDLESAINSGYGSSDETTTLLVITTLIPTVTTNTNVLVKMSSSNGPTTSSSSSVIGSKPVLMRQDRTSTYLVSPQLSSSYYTSEESGNIEEETNQHNARSVPDLEAHLRLETPVISVSNSCYSEQRGGSASGYQLMPHNRCRACRTCDRRASTTPVSSLYLDRSVSKESVRSNVQGHLPPCNTAVVQHIPPVLITSSPNSGSRIIRQSSQPESSTLALCCNGHSCIHPHSVASASLRQLRDPSEAISGIAAESLRINGAMRPFKQVGGNIFRKMENSI